MPSATTLMRRPWARRDHGLDDRAVRVAVEPGDERPVDLDRVERQVLQVGQRRVAGAEVVEHEPDAHVAQPAERPDPDLGLVHHDALGDLELERRRVEPGLGQDRVDLVDEVRLAELAGRQVDRHHQARAARAGRRATRVAWRQAVSSTHRPSGTIRPVSSASGMNDSGGTRPRTGCCQRTSASKPTIRSVVEVDQRLVVDAQLAALDRAPEVVLHVDPVHRLVGHRRLEQRRSAADGVGLGADHRDLGLAEHLVRRRPARPADGDPSDALMNQSRPPIGNGARSSCADPLGDPAGVVDVDDRVEDDPELVAAEARDRVARPERADEALADRGQEPVADGVADALVDDLEPVEVEQDDRDRVGVVGLDDGEGVARSGRSGARGSGGRSSGRGGRRAGPRRTAASCRGRSRRAGRSGPGRGSRAVRTSDRSCPTRAR